MHTFIRRYTRSFDEGERKHRYELWRPHRSGDTCHGLEPFPPSRRRNHPRYHVSIGVEAVSHNQTDIEQCSTNSEREEPFRRSNPHPLGIMVLGVGQRILRGHNGENWNGPCPQLTSESINDISPFRIRAGETMKRGTNEKQEAFTRIMRLTRSQRA